MATAKKWVSGIATAFAVLALLAIAVLFAWPGSYNITNGSMNPTIPIGAKVFTEQPSQYEVGDIITFRAIEVTGGGEIVVTHRLVGFNDDDTLITQGDANDSVDYPAVPVYQSDIIGKVVGQVPVVGGVQMWMMTNPLLWMPVIVIVMVVFIWPLLSKPKASAKDEATQVDSTPAPAAV